MVDTGWEAVVSSPEEGALSYIELSTNHPVAVALWLHGWRTLEARDLGRGHIVLSAIDTEGNPRTVLGMEKSSACPIRHVPGASYTGVDAEVIEPIVRRCGWRSLSVYWAHRKEGEIRGGGIEELSAAFWRVFPSGLRTYLWSDLPYLCSWSLPFAGGRGVGSYRDATMGL